MDTQTLVSDQKLFTEKKEQEYVRKRGETGLDAKADTLAGIRLADQKEKSLSCTVERGVLYEKAYVETNLIAYIGNKRRLLGLITRAIEQACREGEEGSFEKEKGTGGSRWFVDYFSGTGVVSRAAKSMGFNVIANDWEAYSRLLNAGFLKISEKRMEELFREEGGIGHVLCELNALTKFEEKHAYVSQYYCPRSTKQADPDQERLFYTRENGILIDNIRQAIDERYPEKKVGVSTWKDRARQEKRELLLGMLLVEASKRANTSGIFKGFHHGFGGRNGDALGRILAPVHMERPRLSEKDGKVALFKSDALKLAKRLKGRGIKADIVYLDPPYNQHQYGSNYHLLNTIALGDQPLVKRKFWINGKKVQKSAIRRDWVQTRSTFCYKSTALRAFKNLIEAISARVILVSYSTEGIIDFSSMLEVLAAKGKLSVVTDGYVRFRGGRQTNVTKKLNVEFVLIVDVGKASEPRDIERVKRTVGEADCMTLFDSFFPVHKHSSLYDVRQEGETYVLDFSCWQRRLRLDRKLHLIGGEKLLPDGKWKTRGKREAMDALPSEMLLFLKKMTVATNAERIAGITELLLAGTYDVDLNYFLGELLRLAKKLKGDRKRKELFHQVQASLEAVLQGTKQRVAVSERDAGQKKQSLPWKRKLDALARWVQAVPHGASITGTH